MTQIEPEIEVKNFLDDSDDGPPLDLVGPTTVELPGGIVTASGVIVKTVTVRELNGYDEEKLTRSDVRQPVDFLHLLMKLGVEEANGEKLNEMTIDGLLIGDRDAIVLGIRRATFGNELSYRELTCPSCDRLFDVEESINSIPIKKLEDPLSERVFDVELSHKRIAQVRLATHGDQRVMLKESSKVSDQNTVLLSRCILKINDQPINLRPEPPVEVVRGLNMRDRQVLLKELRDRQPGPDFEGVKITCPSCDYEDRLVIDLVSLFRI